MSDMFVQNRRRNPDVSQELNIMRLLVRIAQYRLKQLEYLNRMDDCRSSKQLLNYNPKERRDVGVREALEWPALVYLLRTGTNQYWFNSC